MPEERFNSAVERIFAIAGTGRTIVLGLSGGVDSVVLTYLASRRRERGGWNGMDVIVAHLDHGLRGEESQRDRVFSRALAKNLGFRFYEQVSDVARYARENGLGVEEAGRVVRYAFFHDLAGPDGIVLTGHHADDQTETILLNIRRGAHRRGLAGMREYSTLTLPGGGTVRIGRPLLRMKRREIVDYADGLGLLWREDESNGDTTYLRNHLRHQALPLLEHILPGFQDRLLAQAERMAGEEDALTEDGRRLASIHSRREGGGRALVLSPDLTEAGEPYRYTLRHIVEEELGARLPYGAALARLVDLGERGHIGETVTLPGCLRVRRESDGLFFFFPGSVEAADEDSGEVILPDPPFEIAVHGFVITAERHEFTGSIPDEDRRDPNVEWLREEVLRWPLSLRTPRPGERFRPIGAPGGRKIQDILMDLKVPRRQRSLPRLVADHAGGVWLWPLRLANRVRLPDRPCRAIRITMRPVSTEPDDRAEAEE